MEMSIPNQFKDVKIKIHEESSRGEIWSEQDTRHLISIWTDPTIQTQLKGLLRNNAVYDEICRRLRDFGVYRTPSQCRNKTKNLRKGFRQLKLRNGPYNKSTTRQSSLFFKELDRVWGKDFLNNTSELETQDGPANLTESKESEAGAELFDGCMNDGSNLSEHIEGGDYLPQGEDLQRVDPERECSSNAYMFHPHHVGSGYAERDREESMMKIMQQVNQQNMERLKDAVVDLNRSFLEQQAAAEERREKLSRDHELRLLEVFLNRGEKAVNPNPVFPVKLVHSEKQQQQPSSKPAGSLLGQALSTIHGQDQSLLSPSSSSSARQPLEACSSYLRCLALRLHPGDEIKESLTRLVEERNVQAACIVSCVGSIRSAELRLADSKTILKLESNHEIVSLVGTLSSRGMHLHASFSDEEGKVVGGHVVGNMEVFTTAEIVIGELPSMVFKREMDTDTGYRELVVEPAEDTA